MPHAIRMAFSRKPYMVCLLLLIILLQTFSKAVIFVDFYANQDYIARNLCGNRDKPMLHCCGRCQLCKRLARQDQQDKNDPGKRANEVSVCRAHRRGYFFVRLSKMR